MKEIRIKLFADKAVLEELQRKSSTQEPSFRIESVTPEKDSTRLGFDLSMIVQILLIISSAANIAKCALEIDGAMKKSHANKTVAQTASQTREFQTGQHSKADVENFLKAERSQSGDEHST